MCEISRSISNLEDTLYDVKSNIRDIEMEVNVDTDDFEKAVKQLNLKFNSLAELFLKLAGVDVYKIDKLDKRVRHRKDVSELSSKFKLEVRGWIDMVKIDGKEYADANEFITDQIKSLNNSLMSIYKTEEEE